MSSVWSGAKVNTTVQICIYSAVSAAQSQPSRFLPKYEPRTLTLFCACFGGLNNLICCQLTVFMSQKPIGDRPRCVCTSIVGLPSCFSYVRLSRIETERSETCDWLSQTLLDKAALLTAHPRPASGCTRVGRGPGPHS